MAEHYIIDNKEHVYESAAEKHLTDKTITQNGTYSAEDEPGDINGYKNVTVDVEGGGGGATLVEKTITENGTYDPADDNADGYSQVSVNVPSIVAFAMATVNVDTNYVTPTVTAKEVTE